MGLITEIKSAIELLQSWKKAKPSEPEKIILMKALKSNGEIYVLSTDQTGDFVRIGNEDLCSNTDASVSVKYLEALAKLRKREFVVQESGKLFKLTGTGFEEARKLQ